MPESTNRIPVAIAIFSFCITACEPSELRPVPVGVPAGSGYSAPSRPAQPKPTASSFPMIDNPDAETDYDSEVVWAVDEYEAQRKCEQIALSRSDRTVIVTVQGRPQKLTKTPSKYGSYRFLCNLRIEHQ